ncbi:hypothetical protein [Streptomyces sp. B21-108]|jgi:hypothetical protein|uniref:hypothetical protein n=1 Tax=Streptomyces sp. B21-108 TaxID=3039419 RepID=UPI002FF40111
MSEGGSRRRQEPSIGLEFAGFSVDQAGREHVGATAMPVAYKRAPLAGQGRSLHTVSSSDATTLAVQGRAPA